jgi:hypothetical protein
MGIANRKGVLQRQSEPKVGDRIPPTIIGKDENTAVAIRLRSVDLRSKELCSEGS